MRSLLVSSTLFYSIKLCIAGYVLQDDYTPSTFLNMFNAFSGPDPTEGFVQYGSLEKSKNLGLITTTPQSVKLSVDSTNITPNGRPSVRLESKKSYDSGLIILDLAHMPGGTCGTWPAFWTVGPNWPHNGEIDIIEGVNSQTINAMTLHTAPGCSISSTGKFNGNIKTANCDINAPGQGNNVGCGISAKGANTYGESFNSVGGGVYATEWTNEYIAVYHFQRDAIPEDIKSGKPDPSGWQTPLALFQGSCDIDNAIKNQSIVFDTTFCGQWAGSQNVWQSDSVCASKAPTCKEYVQNNPSAFAKSYWEINSLKVYQLGETPKPAVSPSGPPSSPSIQPPVVNPSPSAIPSSFPSSPVAPPVIPVSPPTSIASSPAASPTTFTMKGPNYTLIGIMPPDVAYSWTNTMQAYSTGTPQQKGPAKGRYFGRVGRPVKRSRHYHAIHN